MHFFFDKVTTGTYNLVSVISNFHSVDAIIAGSATRFAILLTKAQFFNQVKINSTSKLISGIFKLIQKLLMCFSGITTSV